MKVYGKVEEWRHLFLTSAVDGSTQGFDRKILKNEATWNGRTKMGG